MLILALVIIVLGAYVFSQNDRYFTAFNITAIQGLVAALGFIAHGADDRADDRRHRPVGRPAGRLPRRDRLLLRRRPTAPFSQILLGFVLMLLAAIVTGTINGFLIRFGKFTPVAATLAVYIALQGLSFVLRDGPDGIINASITGAIKTKIGPFPVAFIVLVLFAFALEFALRYTRWGLALRAVGSNEEAARRVGVRVEPHRDARSYIAVSLLRLHRRASC